MTITIETPPELEEAITREAERAGLSVQEYVLRAVADKAQERARLPREFLPPDGFSGTLAEAMAPFLGSVGGTIGPDDGTGRAWSEIEAACDPL